MSSSMATRSFKSVVLLYLLKSIIPACEGSINDNELPKMYKMQDYRKCYDNKGTYCLLNFKIEPHDPESKLWITIKEAQNNPLKLDRSILHRMICVPNSLLPEPYGKKIIENELTEVNATINITGLDCEREWSFPYFKAFFWISVTVYFAITFQSTRYHYIDINNPHWPKSEYKKWYDMFSIIRNFQKLWENNTNLDFQRLKSIQGIRVFNTMLVVFWHSTLSLFQVYIDDIDELEKNFESSFLLYMMFLGAFSVQIFFLISTFLLTNQIYELHKKHGEYTIQDWWILMMNRLFRFFPTLLLALAVPMIEIYDNCPHTIRTKNACLPVCQRYWWFTLLQINFLLPFDKICTPGLWYLSVDTFYYTATLVILYLVLKYNWNVWKLTGGLMLFVIIYFGARIYINGYDFMFQPYPEALKNMISSKAMAQVYVPPLASWPSSLIGLILGYIYFNNKQKQNIIISIKLRILWWLTFACIPLFALHMSTSSYSGLSASIIGSLLKPMFVLPLGIGILGMAFGLGGLVKTFLESNILLILSNVTYCTYVFHFFIVFAKGLFLTELFHYKSHHMIFWIVFDVVMAFALGTIGTILIEYPGLAFQKRYIPQIKKIKRY